MRQKKASPDPRKENRFFVLRGTDSPARGWSGGRCCGGRFSHIAALVLTWSEDCVGASMTVATLKSSGDSLLLRRFSGAITFAWRAVSGAPRAWAWGADLPRIALLVLRCYVALTFIGDGVLDVTWRPASDHTPYTNQKPPGPFGSGGFAARFSGSGGRLRSCCSIRACCRTYATRRAL